MKKGKFNYLTKRVLSVVLSLVMTLSFMSVLSVSVLADDYTEYYIASKEYYYYVSAGDEVTLEAVIYDQDWNEFDELPDGYTCKWYTDDSIFTDDFGDYVGEGLSYTLTVPDDIYSYAGYYCVLYYDEESEDITYFWVIDKDTYWMLEADNEYYVSVGEEITLSPVFYDYEGNQIDTPDGLTFEWTKWSDDGDTTIENATDATYTFTVAEDDIYTDDYFAAYVLYVYHDDELLGIGMYVLYEDGTSAATPTDDTEEVTNESTTDVDTTETTTASNTDSSAKSPQTGYDDILVLLVLAIVFAGAGAIVSAKKIKKNNA